MKLYTNPLSPNCRKVDAVAKQLGIDVTHQAVDVAAGETRTPEFRAINPNGKVPVLVDGDITLWESNAIQCYLASKTDNDLWPKSNVRYDIIRWQSWELAHFGSVGRDLISERMLKPLLKLGETDQAKCAQLDEQWNKFASVLDAHLANNRFVAGGQLTIADFCVASSLTYAKPAQLPVDRHAHISSWLSALDEQPGWRASAPPPM